MEDSQIQVFFDMMQECYGVCGWIYDRDLEIRYTNSPSPNLYKVMLLGRGRAEAILEHAAKRDVPMIISDSIGLMWGVVENKTGKPEDMGDFYILGPILNKELSTQMLGELLVPFDLSLTNKWALIHNLNLLPCISTVIFFQQVIMLHYYVNGQKVRISAFDYYTPRQEAPKGGRLELQEEVPHAPHITEKKLLDMVRTGNLEYHEALSFASSVSPGIRTKSSDPIRQAKYSVVAFITLCTRAAIEGGLSPECAYTLSDTYTESVDSCKTISEIAAVSHTMYDDFIHRVNRCRNSNGVSRPVQACCDYIDNHPMAEFSVDDLAAKAGYTTYYFSRVFKKETGKTIKEYIRDARIYQSKMLLSTTNLSIQEISEQLHFCSQSYFAGQFQKVEGIAPADYRNKYKNC